MSHRPIGIFDSGVGGLSVLREIRELLPDERLLYFADQANVPYGPRPLDEVRRISHGAVRFLLSQGTKLIVVACNTASGAALHDLRECFPGVPFVGMEPAVKPAAQRSRTKAIGVLATPGTFQGSLFEKVVDRFAREVSVHASTCPGLVEAVERGAVDGADLRDMLAEQLAPLLAQGIDTLVLGCTHYPFARAAIEAVVGPEVEVVDPAPAVARQVERVLASAGLLSPRGPGSVEYYTSGSPEALSDSLRLLLREEGVVRRAAWEEKDVDGCRALREATSEAPTPRPLRVCGAAMGCRER